MDDTKNKINSTKKIQSFHIKGMINTEKTHNMRNDGVIVLKVDKRASKTSLLKEIEVIFGVKPKKVRTLNIDGKKRNFRRILGYRSDIKKVYVKFSDISALNELGSNKVEE